MNCKIMCEGKECATIECKESGISINYTEDGKKMCANLGGGCCC